MLFFLNMFKNMKDNKGYLELKKVKPEFVKNFESDEQLDNNIKMQFLQYLSQFSSSSQEVLEYSLEFIRMLKQVGSDYCGSATLFIRINDVNRFKGRINEITKRDVSRRVKELLKPDIPIKVRNALYKAILSEPIKEDILHKPDKANYYLGKPALPAGLQPELGEAQTGSYIEWSYPSNETEDVFSNSSKNSLDCRAGLSENQDLDKVLYSHNIKHCHKVTKPTIFDAEFYPQFKPGGMTKPLQECEEQNGLEEYVHTPNLYKSIVQIDIIQKEGK